MSEHQQSLSTNYGNCSLAMPDSTQRRYDRRFLAKIISGLGSPMILAFPAFIVLLVATNPPSLPLLLLMAFLFGSAFPMLVIYLMYKTGKIGDLDVTDRSQRKAPFILSILVYALGTIIMFALNAPAIVSALMFGYTTNTLVLFLISLHWKISVHAVGVSGPFTCLIYFLGWLYSPLLLLIIPIGWSRIELKAHTLAQVVVGFLLSIALTWIQLVLLFQFFL
jgi:membrane-associated phospholipid phosphatase